jgi:hypothetical protein
MYSEQVNMEPIKDYLKGIEKERPARASHKAITSY